MQFSHNMRHFSVRLLTLLTGVMVLIQIMWGGVVRLTESGLGCPDWPLCYGQIVPPPSSDAVIEYAHRVIGMVVGLMVLSTVGLALTYYRRELWVVVPAVFGGFLVILAGVLGAISVLTELASMFVVAHFVVAEMLLGCVVICYLALYKVGTFSNWNLPSTLRLVTKEKNLCVLLALFSGLLFILLVTGSYTTMTGSWLACGSSWPLCNGNWLPQNSLALIHMIHRFSALIVGVITIWLTARFMTSPYTSVRIKVGISGFVILFLGQILIGAASVWQILPFISRLAHLFIASCLWIFSISLLISIWLTKEKSALPGDSSS